MGYHMAGFRVVGVDILPQPDYPFEFIHSCALWYAERFGHRYEYIHASPPCQGYSYLTRGRKSGRKYPMLIPRVREILDSIGSPYVIENVEGAPLRPDLLLCGEMFGLDVIRHRLFEFGGWTMGQLEHPPHRGVVSGYRHGEWKEGPYMAVYGKGGGKGSIPEWQDAMGIHWTESRESIAEAIPPAYTEHIGERLLIASRKTE